MLQFCRNNKDPNEFFAPLLEKAYAKVTAQAFFFNKNKLKTMPIKIFYIVKYVL